MKKILFFTPLLLLSLFIFSFKNRSLQKFDCVFKDNSHIKPQPDTITFDTLKCGLNFKKGQHYKNTKNKMITLRIGLNQFYSNLESPKQKENFLDSISILFSQNLLNKIIPYWYGTEWDFNGYTAIPNQGVIACGYFVSTTLRDMGLNVNRYQLARQNPENEAKTVSINKENSFTLKRDDFHSLDALLNKIKKGLYFVGLNSHVGYLYKNKHATYFIHSNYIQDQVMIEMATHSMAFESDIYYLSKISNNRIFALSWIQNKEIKIIKS